MPVFYIIILYVSYYFTKVKGRNCHGINSTIMPMPGDSLLLTTGAAFIRDKFVDYPNAQFTKREIKARAGCE